MRSFLLAVTFPLVFASLDQSPANRLVARQGGDAFQPGTTPGAQCGPEDQCGGGDGSQVVCLDRSQGDVCCAENYGCPGGSFCLTKGFCCPNGDDPNTCAQQNGITLPAGFTAGAVISSGAASSATAVSSPTSAPAVTTSSGTKPISTPSYPVSKNSTTPSATGATTSKSTTVPFTGGANAISMGLSGMVTALVGGYFFSLF